MYRSVIVLCALVAIASASPLSGRIVGGQDARVGQFPYQISLRADGGHNCGGSIINNRWILSAAHCLEGWPVNRLSVAVGTINLNDPNARVYQVESTEYHSGWDSWSMFNDIGLLRVSEDIEFNDNVQPIPLNTADIGDGEPLTLSGWGRIRYPGELPEILQWIQLSNFNLEECRAIHWDITSNQICTLNRPGQGACQGDSGGPLAYNGQLVGVVSWGIPCALGQPDVFTRVSSYISWIEERIA